jgi:hypothetical protein
MMRLVTSASTGESTVPKRSTEGGHWARDFHTKGGLLFFLYPLLKKKKKKNEPD